MIHLVKRGTQDLKMSSKCLPSTIGCILGLFIEMGEAKWGTGKPRALFVYTKLEMPLRCPCGNTVACRDLSSGERSAISRLEILNSRVIRM